MVSKPAMNRFIIVAIIAVALSGGALYTYNYSKNNTAVDHTGAEHETENTQPVDQSHRSYQLEVISDTLNIKPNQPTTITYRVKNDKGAILKNYEVTHEKIMHFILVRKDLQQFQHLHPEFNQSNGEFSVQVTFPTDGTFRIFPDFTPGDENPMKLPVTLNQDINVGDPSKLTPQQVKVDSSPSKTVEGYAITYKLNPSQPISQNEFTYTLTVSRNGQPVTDLEPYLGALGHSVILKEGTLDFIHTHAGEAAPSGMDHGAMTTSNRSGPDISFSTTFPEGGSYRLFTQFQHQGKIITTDYTIQVK